MMHTIILADFDDEKVCSEIQKCINHNYKLFKSAELVGCCIKADKTIDLGYFDREKYYGCFSKWRTIKRKNIVILVVDDSVGDNKIIPFYPTCSEKYITRAVSAALNLCNDYSSIDEIPKNNLSTFLKWFIISDIVVAAVIIIGFLLS